MPFKDPRLEQKCMNNYKFTRFEEKANKQNTEQTIRTIHHRSVYHFIITAAGSRIENEKKNFDYKCAPREPNKEHKRNKDFNIRN